MMKQLTKVGLREPKLAPSSPVERDDRAPQDNAWVRPPLSMFSISDASRGVVPKSQRRPRVVGDLDDKHYPELSSGQVGGTGALLPLYQGPLDHRSDFAMEALLAVQAASGYSLRRPFTKLYRHVRDLAVRCNPEEAIAFMKATSTSARQRWINGSGGASAQLSYLGRALPQGSPAVVQNALQAHREAFSEEFPCAASLRRAATRFASNWARQFCPPATVGFAPDEPTLSSCLESRVKEGGLRAFVDSLGLHEKTFDALELLQSETGEAPYREVTDLMRHVSLMLHGTDFLTNMDGHPRAVAVALPERGNKCRVVTKAPGGLHLLSHLARKRILSGLRRDPRSQSTLEGVSDEGLINNMIGAEAQIAVSTDLKAASDMLPLDLVAAIVEGLAKSGKFPNLELEALRIACGPQQLSHPDLGPEGGSEFLTKRGIMMGLPTTWGILSLVHLFWWDHSVRVVARRRKVSSNSVWSRCRLQICGDDAMFIGPEDVANAYNNLLPRVGAVASPGKHFVSRPLGSASGALRAVFIERLFQFRQSSGRVTGGVRNAAFPVRGLVRPVAPREISKTAGSMVKVAPEVSMWMALDTLRDSHSTCDPLLSEFIMKWCPWIYRWTADVGLLRGLPIRLGGTGLPLRPGQRQVSDRCLAAAISMSEEGDTPPSLIRGVVSRRWRKSARAAQLDHEGLLELGPGKGILISDQDPDLDRMYVNSGSTRQWIDGLTMHHYWSKAMEPDKIRPSRVKISKLEFQLRRWSVRLSKRIEATPQSGSPGIAEAVERYRSKTMPVVYMSKRLLNWDFHAPDGTLYCSRAGRERGAQRLGLVISDRAQILHQVATKPPSDVPVKPGIPPASPQPT